MKRSVLKFGGTSVSDQDRIDNVARIVAARAQRGEALAVTVSAMAGRTDALLRLAGHDGAEYNAENDTIVSCGEQICAGMLALSLQRLGLKARSWLGWQLGVRTTGCPGRARIAALEASADLAQAVDGGEIAVIAGFQGVSEDGRVTTLGRGGSDTTAVAVAVALGAERCDIYTDVDGVYTADPRIVALARRIERISHEEMLELASMGTTVLQARSVELAMNYGIALRVVSSFNGTDGPEDGSLVCMESDIVEKTTVAGIAYSFDEAKISLFGIDDNPGTAASVFAAMAECDINVDMIVQAKAQAQGKQNIVFTVGEGDAETARRAIDDIGQDIGCVGVQVETGVAKVSIVGIGMRSHTGVARTMFETLAKHGINIQAIAASEIKISVLVDADYTELAVRALHTAYELDSAR